MSCLFVIGVTALEKEGCYLGSAQTLKGIGATTDLGRSLVSGSAFLHSSTATNIIPWPHSWQMRGGTALVQHSDIQSDEKAAEAILVLCRLSGTLVEEGRESFSKRIGDVIPEVHPEKV